MKKPFFSASLPCALPYAGRYRSIAVNVDSAAGRVSAEMKKYVSLLLTSSDVGCMFKKTPVSLAQVRLSGCANASATSRRGEVHRYPLR
ncbi:hypothetical protein ACR6A7_06735 [Pantoea sp. RRHST58]|uniref:hypothetical protein n=1 Tax=Pantoea sp. RRHST58 TaxID=3425183 RepID=UPI003DA0D6F3